MRKTSTTVTHCHLLRPTHVYIVIYSDPLICRQCFHFEYITEKRLNKQNQDSRVCIRQEIGVYQAGDWRFRVKTPDVFYLAEAFWSRLAPILRPLAAAAAACCAPVCTAVCADPCACACGGGGADGSGGSHDCARALGACELD